MLQYAYWAKYMYVCVCVCVCVGGCNFLTAR